MGAASRAPHAPAGPHHIRRGVRYLARLYARRVLPRASARRHLRTAVRRAAARAARGDRRSQGESVAAENRDQEVPVEGGGRTAAARLRSPLCRARAHWQHVPTGLDGRRVPLATAWRFVQDDVAIAEPTGELGANVHYQFAYRDGTTSLQVEGVEVAIRGLVLTERTTNAPLLALDEVDVVGVSGDVIARQLTGPEISVKRGRVAATLARDGSVNWQRLGTTSASPAPPVARPATAETRPWRVAVEKLRVDDVALALVDESRAAPLALDVGGLS